MYVAPPPPPAPKKKGMFGDTPPSPAKVTLVKVNGKIVTAKPPGTRLHVPGYYDDLTQVALDVGQQQQFGADAPATPAKTAGTIIGALIGSGIGAKIGSVIGGLIKTSKSPQRVQQAQQMAQAVTGGNLSALRRLRERYGQFADDANGFGPALRLLQQNGVIDSSDRFLVGTPGLPWTEEGHAEMFDGPPVFSTTRPPGAVDHPEAYAGPVAAAPTPVTSAPVLQPALPTPTPQITPPASAPILPGAPPTVNTPVGAMTPEQIKAMVLQLQGQNAVVPDWAKQMLAVLQGGTPPSAPAAPMPVMPEIPGAKPLTAGFSGSTAVIAGLAILGAVLLGGKKRGRR